MNRTKFDTAIEKEVHRLIRDIREHMYDFTHLYVRRNGIELDRPTMEKVLEIVKLAIDDGELSKIGMFHERMKNVVDEFAGEEQDSFQPHTSTQPTTPLTEVQAAQPTGAPLKKVTFQL